MPSKKRTAKRAAKKKASKRTAKKRLSSAPSPIPASRSVFQVPRHGWPSEQSAVAYIARTQGLDPSTLKVEANDSHWRIWQA